LTQDKLGGVLRETRGGLQGTLQEGFAGLCEDARLQAETLVNVVRNDTRMRSEIDTAIACLQAAAAASQAAAEAVRDHLAQGAHAGGV
jgi:hypothetical protein